jgi:hypothetical protein
MRNGSGNRLPIVNCPSLPNPLSITQARDGCALVITQRHANIDVFWHQDFVKFRKDGPTYLHP